MTSPAAIRDPRADHMLTPENAALVIIDFQPVQVSSIVTMIVRWEQASPPRPVVSLRS